MRRFATALVLTALLGNAEIFAESFPGPEPLPTPRTVPDADVTPVLETAVGSLPPPLPLPTPPAPGPVKTEVGLIYLHPFFQTQNFNIPFPANGGVAFIGATKDGIQSFNVAPVFRVDYIPDNLNPPINPDWLRGAGLTALVANLSSTLTRDATVGNTTVHLQTTNTLAMTTVNALEYILQTRPLLSPQYPSQFTFRTGFRYSHLTQTFDALVNPGVSHLASNQDFNGFGLTCAIEWKHILCSSDKRTKNGPVDPAYNWVSGFVRIRGSALLGPNARSSSFSSGFTNTPGIPANSNVAESETSFVPVGELDLGVEFWPGWHWFFDPPSNAAIPVPPRLSVILASNSQIWANVGMPSALSPSHRPDNGALYLVGAFMSVKLHW